MIHAFFDYVASRICKKAPQQGPDNLEECLHKNGALIAARICREDMTLDLPGEWSSTYIPVSLEVRQDDGTYFPDHEVVREGEKYNEENIPKGLDNFNQRTALLRVSSTLFQEMRKALVSADQIVIKIPHPAIIPSENTKEFDYLVGSGIPSQAVSSAALFDMEAVPSKPRRSPFSLSDSLEACQLD